MTDREFKGRSGRLAALWAGVLMFGLSAAWAGPDADGDRLSDEREMFFGSDPMVADTDGGGMTDEIEYVLGLDPRNADDDVECVDPANYDCDGDGLSIQRERFLGTDPLVADSDGGGIDDGTEHDLGTDPTVASDDSLNTLSGGDLGGCEASSGSGAWAALLMMFGLIALGRRRWFAGLAALAVCAALPRPASADPKIDVQTFRPMPNLFDHHLHAIAPHAIEGDQWTLGLLGQFADDSLVVNDATDDRTASLVHHQVTAHLIGSLSLGGRVELGLDLPVVLYQTGDDDIAGFGPRDVLRAEAALGDARLVPKFVLYSDVSEDSPSGNSIALAGDFYLPVGDKENFAGEGFRVEPRLAYGYQWAGGSSFAINGGYRFREKKQYRDVVIDDLLTYSVAFDIATGADIHIVPEINGGYAITEDTYEAEQNPLEGLLAVKWFGSDEAMLIAGGGIGLSPALGVPDWRAFLGFQLSGTGEEPPPEDTDGDGLPDDEDRCPNEPEDLDGFEDEDGCPDLDNDQDGIGDADDKCPNEPEDLDGEEDEDGCPEDSKDKDGDGILDAEDKCPDEAEDKDDFEDEDGCPDPDNDKDGIADAEDKCPNEAEVVNGFEDEDGCPDTAKVKVSCDRIELEEKVFFELGKADVQPKSKSLLAQVAAAMKNNPEIKKVRVEGHTDSQGSDKFNQKLSQERVDSVVKYLVEIGQIDAGRLGSKGMGERKPIASNDTEEGRAKNRRVELHITERDVSDECKAKAKK